VCWRRALAATVEEHQGGARREGRAGLPACVAGKGEDAGPHVQGKGGGWTCAAAVEAQRCPAPAAPTP
jgi:hypothetical protein